MREVKLMKQSIKKTIIYLTIVYALLMVIFIFKDLDISLCLLNYDSFFGKLGQSFAEVPMDFLTMCAYAIIFLTRDNTKSFINYFLKIISFIAAFEYSFFMVYYVFKFAEFSNALIIGIIGGIIFGVFAFYLCSKLLIKHKEELIKIAVVIIFSVLLEELFVNVIKLICYRPRMRDLVTLNDFVPWYKPFGNHLKGDSFSSGHSARAMGVIFITLLSDSTNKKNFMYLISAIWVISIMLSRIVLGAHFASDTITGAYIMFLSFLIVKSIVYRGKYE